MKCGLLEYYGSTKAVLLLKCGFPLAIVLDIGSI